MRSQVFVCLLAFVVLIAAERTYLWAQDNAAPLTAQAWDLPQAIDQLQLYPRDAYLQYVVMQLSASNGDQASVADLVRRSSAPNRPDLGRSEEVDLFSIFSGALAVQESLQLDAMLNSETIGDQPSESLVPIDSLAGPTIQSHPWDELLGSRTPPVSELSRYIPEDYFLLEFRRPSQLLGLLRDLDRWLTYYSHQARQNARQYGVPQRLIAQLALQPNDLLAPAYDLAIGELAIAGSDLYHREGSDLTVLFLAKQPALVKPALDNMLQQAAANVTGSSVSSGTYRGVEYQHVTSPGRVVHAFSANPRPELHVRSNSLPAFQRVLDAIVTADEPSPAVVTLGRTKEFAYIRSLMPRDDGQEDGLLYLSDPFIRRLIGPKSKLSQVRRMQCATHLRMLQHAALMHVTQYGRRAENIAELIAHQCLPASFESPKSHCPCGGEYSLQSDDLTGVCSHHGTATHMRPTVELPLEFVSSSEAEQYKAFVTRYSEYWRTYFDPIAVRLHRRPTGYRLETIVLPLIDNSIYQGLHRFLSGPTVALDQMPVADSSIFSLGFKFDRAQLMAGMGWDAADGTAESRAEWMDLNSTANQLRMVGLALHNFESSYGRFPPVNSQGPGPSRSLSWRVHILPFLGQQELYSQFHLDESWDSPHNRSLIDKMPDFYRTAAKDLPVGHTTIVAPRTKGQAPLLGGSSDGLALHEILDGTSNTVMLMEGDAAQAIVWTKPDTLEVDPDHARRGLRDRQGRLLVLMADGSTSFVRRDASDAEIVAILTPSGGEFVAPEKLELVTAPQSRSTLAFLDKIPTELDPAGDLPNLLAKGLGDQISLHVCDDDPLVDLNVSQFLGMVASIPRGAMMSTETLWVSGLVLSLNTPVYLAIPVQDPAIVDRGLAVIDRYLARVAQEPIEPGFLRMTQDYYTADRSNNESPPADGDASENRARTYTLSFGPIKWRFCWSRIGNGLYIASKPHLLDELSAAHQQQASAPPPESPPIMGHGLVHVRPTHWRRILPQLQLGWAENQRISCIRNLGPHMSVARALQAEHGGAPPTAEQIDALAFKIYGMAMECPEHGRFELSAGESQVACSVHGSAIAPRQPLRPSPDSRLGALLGGLTDVRLNLAFLEDGLHAVVEIDEAPADAP